MVYDNLVNSSKRLQVNENLIFINQNHQVDLKTLPNVQIYEELKNAPQILKPQKFFLSKSSFHPAMFKPLNPLKIENEICD